MDADEAKKNLDTLGEIIRTQQKALTVALRDRDAALENLTATQERCNQLLEAERTLKREVFGLWSTISAQTAAWGDLAEIERSIRMTMDRTSTVVWKGSVYQLVKDLLVIVPTRDREEFVRVIMDGGFDK